MGGHSKCNAITIWGHTHDPSGWLNGFQLSIASIAFNVILHRNYDLLHIVQCTMCPYKSDVCIAFQDYSKSEGCGGLTCDPQNVMETFNYICERVSSIWSICKNIKTPSDYFFKFKEDNDSTWWCYAFWEQYQNIHQWKFFRLQLLTITQMLTLHNHITDVLQWSWKTSIQQRTQLERKKIKPHFSIQIE